MHSTLRQLRRGGTVVETRAGLIQFGIPPETIKDTINTAQGVPGTFVAVDPLFESKRGISLCELEFPLYYNFYVLKRPTRVVCTKEQRRRITSFVTESAFGPESVDPTTEYLGGRGNRGLPDLRKEMEVFRRNPFRPEHRTELSDLLQFVVFDEDEASVDLGEGVVLHRDESADLFRLFIDGTEVTTIPVTLSLPPSRHGMTGRATAHSSKSRTSFYPPLFGVTVIGSGHGFDPSADTSGFILWINHRGIIVDPPVDSTAWLHERRIPRKLVNALILTHCHADHDAGTLQKLFEEHRIPIYTSRTIMESFVRKAAAITGLSIKGIRSLMEYQPIAIGLPIRINGAEFRFSYTLHSIPALGFESYFLGKSFVYSGDTLNDPDEIEKLHASGVLSTGRRDDLLDFPWHHNLIFHEAGVPPLHTPVSRLASLAPTIKQRLFVLHVGRNAIPADSDLRMAKPGISNTIRIHVEKGQNSRAIELLTVVNGCELFRSFPLNRASDFLSIARTERYTAGTVVLHEDAVGSTFYLILSGQASIVKNDEVIDDYGPGDYFGETAVVMDMPRTANVVARTDLVCIVLEKTDFLYFVRGTDVPLKLRRLYINRQLGLTELLQSTAPFIDLSATQRAHLETYMDSDFALQGSTFVQQGTPADRVFIITEGRVRMESPDGNVVFAGPQTFISDTTSLLAGGCWSFSIRAEEDLRFFILKRTDLLDFLDLNPGFYFHLCDCPTTSPSSQPL